MDRSAVAAPGALDEVGFADEPGDPARRRGAIQLIGCTDLFDPPVAHHRDLITQDERLVLVVGHEHRGHTDIAQDPGDLGANVDAQAGVERGERFVEQEHRRVGGERSGERNALLLTARQGVGESIAESDEVDQLEEFVDSLRPLGAIRFRRTRSESERDVLGHGEVGEQCTVLKDHADVSVLGLHPGRRRRHGHTADRDRSGPRPFQAGDGPQQRGLAASGWSEQGDDAARLDRQRDVAYGVGAPPVGDGHGVDVDAGERSVHQGEPRPTDRTPRRRSSAVVGRLVGRAVGHRE